MKTHIDMSMVQNAWAKFHELDSQYRELLSTKEQDRTLAIARTVVRTSAQLWEAKRPLVAFGVPYTRPKIPSLPIWAMNFAGLGVNEPCWEGR